MSRIIGIVYTDGRALIYDGSGADPVKVVEMPKKAAAAADNKTAGKSKGSKKEIA